MQVITPQEGLRRFRRVNAFYMSSTVLNKNRKYLANAQKKQLRKGQTSIGKLISKKYAPRYSVYKQKLSTYQAPKGTPDLYLKGAFHRGIYVNVQAGKLTFGSKDSKESKLQGKYGDTIFGLNQFSIAELKNALLAKRLTLFMNQVYKIGKV